MDIGGMLLYSVAISKPRILDDRNGRSHAFVVIFGITGTTPLMVESAYVAVEDWASSIG